MPVDVTMAFAATAGISVFADKLQRDIRGKFQLSTKITIKKEDPKSGIFDVIVDGVLVHSVTKLRHSTQVSGSERTRVYDAIQAAIDRPAGATAEGYSRPGSQADNHSDKPSLKIQYSGRNEHKINEYKLFAARKKDDFKKQFGDLVDVTMVHDKANEDALEFYISGTARAVYSTKRGDPPQVRLEDFQNMVQLLKRQLPAGKEASPGSKTVAAPAGEPELLKKAAEKAAEAPAPKVTQVEEVEPVSPTISEGRRTSHNNIRNQFDEMDEALSKGLMKPIDVTVYYSGEASHHIHATKLMDELDREYGKKVSVQMQKDNDKRQHMEITVGGRLVHSQAKKGHSAQIHIDELHCLKNYISGELVKHR